MQRPTKASDNNKLFNRASTDEKFLDNVNKNIDPAFANQAQ